MRGGSAFLIYVVTLYGGRNRAAKRQRRRSTASWRRSGNGAGVHSARRELAGLDDYLLHDIGLSRSQAQFESGKPFWRA